MAILIREKRKQDFSQIMSAMEVDPEDTAHDLFMALTKNVIRIIVTMLNMYRKCLKDRLTTDDKGNHPLI